MNLFNSKYYLNFPLLKNKKLSHPKLLQADKDSRKAAEAAHLIYVTAGIRGFTRKKIRNGFIYLDGNHPVKKESHLLRIKKLAIPPSWENVWICRSAKGHIQATGFDQRNRKQYRYHAEWSKLRDETKFHRLYEFGKQLPRLRKKIKKDLRPEKLTQEKVLAAAINLMEKTYIRVGNESYEKENGSYGLATLKDKHVNIQKNELTVSFRGKKGVKQNISLKNKKLANIIKQCRDIPGKPLFQYYDDANKRKAIDSSMLNNYIKEATAPEFSAKDIRTWAGSVQAIEYFLCNFPAQEDKEHKSVNEMLDRVSKKLGNTRNICKKYYIHPVLISLCEEKKELPEITRNATGDFNTSEQLLMHILRNK